MIQQIAPILTTTNSVNGIDRGLLKARHIQAKLREQAEDDKPQIGLLWTPTALPYLVSITRWIE
jgi:hypothetical protein